MATKTIKPNSDLLLWVVLLLNTLLFSGMAPAQELPHSVTISLTHYPPILDVKGSVGTDIATAVFASQGIKVQFHQYPIPRIFWAVERDNIDAVLGSRSWLKRNQLSDEYIPVQVYRPQFYFYGLKKNFPDGIHFNELSDLKDKNILYLKGGALAPLFKKFNIQPYLVSRLEQSPYIIKSGRQDLFIALGLAGWDIIKEAYPEEYSEFIQSEKPVYSMTGDILFPKKSQYMVSVFQKGLAEIINNGTYNEIMLKYYPDGKIPGDIRQLMKASAQLPVEAQEPDSP